MTGSDAPGNAVSTIRSAANVAGRTAYGLGQVRLSASQLAVFSDVGNLSPPLTGSAALVVLSPSAACYWMAVIRGYWRYEDIAGAGRLCSSGSASFSMPGFHQFFPHRRLHLPGRFCLPLLITRPRSRRLVVFFYFSGMCGRLLGLQSTTWFC